MLNGLPVLDHNRLFSSIDFAGRRAVIAAVSGGGDSTALLLLLKRFFDTRQPDVQMIAATVDHGLRPESAAEAEAVARLCGARGIPHQTLRWQGEKPRTGVAAAAREARYRLLADAAKRATTDLVFIGHTEDDQAETVLMREGRGVAGAGGRGVAAIAPATLHRDVWFIRPLLGVSRQTLRDYLTNTGTQWIDDPTNENPAYERVRAREAIVSAGGDERLRLKTLAVAAAERREMEGEASARMIGRHTAHAAPGLIRLAPEFPWQADSAAALYALRILLATVGGREQLPEIEQARVLLDELKMPGFRATLSRSVVDARKAGIFVRREARGLPLPVDARDGMVWDGRHRIEIDDDGHLPLIAPYGLENARRAEPPDAVAPKSLVRAALAAQPAFWREGTATLAEKHATPLVAPWARFLPSFDLAPARAVAALVGAKPFPAPPFAGHIKGKA